MNEEMKELLRSANAIDGRIKSAREYLGNHLTTPEALALWEIQLWKWEKELDRLNEELLVIWQTGRRQYA